MNFGEARFNIPSIVLACYIFREVRTVFSSVHARCSFLTNDRA